MHARLVLQGHSAVHLSLLVHRVHMDKDRYCFVVLFAFSSAAGLLPYTEPDADSIHMVGVRACRVPVSWARAP